MKLFLTISLIIILSSCKQTIEVGIKSIHQPVISKPFILDLNKCTPKTTLDSPLNWYSAVLTQNDLSKVSYDKSKANIQIIGKNGQSFFITVQAFKSCDIMWINESLLYIHNQLGHVASFNSIYDCKNKKWLIRDITYFTD